MSAAARAGRPRSRASAQTSTPPPSAAGVIQPTWPETPSSASARPQARDRPRASRRSRADARRQGPGGERDRHEPEWGEREARRGRDREPNRERHERGDDERQHRANAPRPLRIARGGTGERGKEGAEEHRGSERVGAARDTREPGRANPVPGGENDARGPPRAS